MKQRTFGKSDFAVSEVGLGCWQLGGSDWGAFSEEDALAILHKSVDQGITFFDTADVYGGGRSETLLGKFRSQCTAPMFIATKLGRRGDPGWPGNFTESVMRAHTDDSLRRLGVETLDLTQLHCIPTEEFRRGDVFDTLRKLRQEGKIRYFGASVESMEEALICLEQEGLASLQIIFNIFRQKPIDTLFEKAQQQGVALIVRLPLASGLLAGKYTKETKFAESDHRNYNRDGQAFNVGETFAGLPFETGVELTEAIRPLVPSGLSMAQMALRWCLDFDGVTTIIPGARNTDTVTANAAASELPPLPAVLHETLQRFYREDVSASIRGPY